MAILIHKLKTLNPKKALAVILLAGLTAFIMSPGLIFGWGTNTDTSGNCTPTPASGAPQFNIWPIAYGSEVCHDLPLLDARNVTRGEGWSTSQSDHDAGISASAGEVIEFSVYYHNGVPNLDENVAMNTIIRALANPSLGSQAAQHTISATIGAQNASTVSSADSGRGGNINVNIQGGTPLALSLVPGSVYLFKDQGVNPKPGAVQMPDTVFTSGVNIGTIRGCWEFHGFLNFRLKVADFKPLSVNLQKTARNVTKNSSFAEQVNADPNDEIEFKLVGTNTGQDVLWHMIFRDDLPAKLSFISGTVQTSQAIVGGDLFSSGGLDVGQANVGQSVTVTFRARVAGSSEFPVGTTILTNTATHWGFGPPSPTRTNDSVDSAMVVVTKQAQVVSCTFTWNSPTLSDGRGSRRVGDGFNVNEHVTGLTANSSFNVLHQHVSGSPSFRYAKTADGSGEYAATNSNTIPTNYSTGDYNVFIEANSVNVATCKGFRIEPPVVQQLDVDKTVGGTSFSDQIDLQPGQRATFQIVISSAGSNAALQNVLVRDTIPYKLTYVTGTFNLNGMNQTPDNFFTAGMNIGNIQPGSNTTITFQADVASAANFVTGSCEILTNLVTVNSGSLSDSDTANVRVCKQAPQKPAGSPALRP